MPQMKRDIVEVIQPVLVERNKGRVADEMVDNPVPWVMEEIMAAVQEEEKLVPQERVQPPTVEHAPVLQILKRDSRGGIGPDGTSAATHCRCANASVCARDRQFREVSPA